MEEGKGLAKNNSPEVFTWQIGSKKPPSVCLCCGGRFSDKRKIRGPYKGPYIWVCSCCWVLPHMFFPDKELRADGTIIEILDRI